jgi:hypothetical protein
MLRLPRAVLAQTGSGRCIPRRNNCGETFLILRYCHTFDQTAQDHRCGTVLELHNNGALTMSTRRADGLRFSRLRRAFLAVLAIAAVTTVAFHGGRAVAQQGGQGQGPSQVQLTAKQVQQYVTAFKQMAPLFEKLDAAGGKPDAKLMAMVEGAVKKLGFKDLDEYDQVVVSIVAVLDGIDPKTKQYTDPVALIKKEIAAVQADKTMKPDERKKALESLTAELSEVQAVQFPGNIPLVIKFFDQLNISQ